MEQPEPFAAAADRLLHSMPVLDAVMPNEPDTTDAEVTEAAKRIIDHFLPDFGTEKLKVKQYTDGITNKLYKYRSMGSDREVLIRIYGNNTELMIDREQEMLVLLSLSQHKLVQPVYGRFENGILYGFVEGTVFSTKDMVDFNKALLVARQLARFHVKGREYVVVRRETKAPRLFETLLAWLNVIGQMETKFSATDEEVSKGHFDLTKYREEVAGMGAALGSLKGHTVFCHNDLLAANIIQASETEVKFIDFEYGSFNDRAFDIANHYCEMMGFEVDPSLYPSDELQTAWLTAYVEESRLQETLLETGKDAEGSVEEEVAELKSAVSHYAAAAHLFWGVWAIVQNEYSLLDDFDFLAYSKMRLAFYQRLKSEDKLLSGEQV